MYEYFRDYDGVCLLEIPTQKLSMGSSTGEAMAS